jgi:hypothetical protein
LQQNVAVAQVNDLMGEDGAKLALRKPRQQAVGNDDRRGLAGAEAEGERQRLVDMVKTRDWRQPGAPAEKNERHLQPRGFTRQQRAGAHRFEKHVHRHAPYQNETDGPANHAPRDAVPAGDDPAAIGKKRAHRGQQRDDLRPVAAPPPAARPHPGRGERFVRHGQIRCQHGPPWSPPRLPPP